MASRDRAAEKGKDHAPRHDSGVQDYLERYGAALMAGDGPTIAAMWEVPAIVIDDDAVIGVASIDEVERFFSAAREQYHARGITATRAEILRLQWATERIVIVDVRWPQLDDAGVEHGDELATYTLRTSDDGTLRIRAVLVRGSSASS